MAVIVVAWLLVDQATKAYFNGFAVGQAIASPIPGVIDFTLVHNTGGAWGMLGNATMALGVVSVIVCIVAIAFLVLVPQQPLLAVVGLSLVVAGGLGNVIDRFSHGYVIDFIQPAFIDFPVFNVADIGVTCGVVLFAASLAGEWLRSSREGGNANDLARPGSGDEGEA